MDKVVEPHAHNSAGRASPAGVEPLATAPLAVVVVTYNSADVLGGLLDSLPGGLDGIGKRDVIVVDNDSGDDSVGIARNHPTRPTVIETGRNAGYAAGINAATRMIRPDANVLVLNPDIRLMPGSARLLRESLRDSSVGVAAPMVLNEDGTLAKSLRREPSLSTAWSDALLGTRVAAGVGLGEIVDDPAIYQRGGKVEWVTGAILMIAARARGAVGEWDESFFLYSEEVDYMERVRRCGFSIGYVPEARAVHIGGVYHENAFLSGLMTTNRIGYYGRHHGRLATSMFRLSIIVGEGMRAGLGPGHRAALQAALHFQPQAAVAPPTSSA
ncbi:glycosyltransferase family 2 protein [Aquamicrobium sp. LC103]|uniref:glycosyltransferase n=1 Tax=Aquamicrobium sp. LC103 TaxID=1120658 RepID=UPI00063EB43D|nr:glycosyltransferase family 2 protein [Aquamicrobium sp. LC103]TKT80274.1 glycosyltransferase family 2 protein [Aquamicrobium sp. LC103]